MAIRLAHTTASKATRDAYGEALVEAKEPLQGEPTHKGRGRVAGLRQALGEGDLSRRHHLTVVPHPVLPREAPSEEGSVRGKGERYRRDSVRERDALGRHPVEVWGGILC